jgi:hypothetical protein
MADRNRNRGEGRKPGQKVVREESREHISKSNGQRTKGKKQRMKERGKNLEGREQRV